MRTLQTVEALKTNFAPVSCSRSSKTIMVTWEPPKNEVRQYELQVKKTTNESNNDTDVPFKTVYCGTATSYCVKELTPATEYLVRIRAETSEGWGLWSAVQAVKTFSGKSTDDR